MTFTKLYTWKKQITGKILSMEGVYSNGINESQNKLSIGVKDKTVKAKVSKKLAKLNISKDAVIIFKMSPPVSLSSLQDQVSSFSGGIKISMSQGWCTMGPTVRWKENASGSFQTGYITASHCTPPLGGGVNSTQFYQPVSGSNYTGIETRDPLFAGNKCWDTGQNCRESDAALISYSGSNPDLISGSIYKTTGRDRDQGSLTIPSYNRHLYVKGIDNFIPQGIENNKIGARTGWTYGTVTEICRDFTVSGLTKVCQNVVQAGADHGDSGAPVFETTASSDSVIFDGILSGGYSHNGSQYYYYSSVTRIKSDLSGPNIQDLTFTAPPPPLSVSINGPRTILNSGQYTWEAEPDHGNGNYNYEWDYRQSFGDSWTQVATTKSYSRFVSQTQQTSHFSLRVIVTSGSEQSSSIANITVNGSDCPPNQICIENN